MLDRYRCYIAQFQFRGARDGNIPAISLFGKIANRRGRPSTGTITVTALRSASSTSSSFPLVPPCRLGPGSNARRPVIGAHAATRYAPISASMGDQRQHLATGLEDAQPRLWRNLAQKGACSASVTRIRWKGRLSTVSQELKRLIQGEIQVSMFSREVYNKLFDGRFAPPHQTQVSLRRTKCCLRMPCD